MCNRGKDKNDLLDACSSVVGVGGGVKNLRILII